MILAIFFLSHKSPNGWPGQCCSAIASNVGLRRDPVVASRRNKPVARLVVKVKRISNNILLLEYAWPFLGIWASYSKQCWIKGEASRST